MDWPMSTPGVRLLRMPCTVVAAPVPIFVTKMDKSLHSSGSIIPLPLPPERVFVNTNKAGAVPLLGTKALIKGWPAGLPNPVQRSKPGTAINSVGLTRLKLLPVVTSWMQL